MVTTGALTENSRQGINSKIPPCIGPGAWLTRDLRPGCGHAYDETPVGLVVYVRNDPVNKIDPDGKDWLGPDGIWYPNIDGGTVTVTAEPDEVEEIPALPGLFPDMSYDADVDPSATGNGRDNGGFSGGGLGQPAPVCTIQLQYRPVFADNPARIAVPSPVVPLLGINHAYFSVQDRKGEWSIIEGGPEPIKGVDYLGGWNYPGLGRGYTSSNLDKVVWKKIGFRMV